MQKFKNYQRKNSDLHSEIVIKNQMEIQAFDHESEEMTTLVEELNEMKANLDRKEYLLQYWEERNTEMEKLLKKRALHDEYVKKRLDHLSIEPK